MSNFPYLSQIYDKKIRLPLKWQVSLLTTFTRQGTIARRQQFRSWDDIASRRSNEYHPTDDFKLKEGKRFLENTSDKFIKSGVTKKICVLWVSKDDTHYQEPNFSRVMGENLHSHFLDCFCRIDNSEEPRRGWWMSSLEIEKQSLSACESVVYTSNSSDDIGSTSISAGKARPQT